MTFTSNFSVKTVSKPFFSVLNYYKLCLIKMSKWFSCKTLSDKTQPNKVLKRDKDWTQSKILITHPKSHDYYDSAFFSHRNPVKWICNDANIDWSLIRRSDYWQREGTCRSNHSSYHLSIDLMKESRSEVGYIIYAIANKHCINRWGERETFSHCKRIRRGH